MTTSRGTPCSSAAPVAESDALSAPSSAQPAPTSSRTTSKPTPSFELVTTLSSNRQASLHNQRSRHNRLNPFPPRTARRRHQRNPWLRRAVFAINTALATKGASSDIQVNCVRPIAYVPAMQRLVERFPPHVHEAFTARYGMEATASSIPGLCRREYEVSGEVFMTAGWALGRYVWEFVNFARDSSTAEDAAREINKGGEKSEYVVFEAQTMVDFTSYQAAFTHKSAIAQ